MIISRVDLQRDDISPTGSLSHPVALEIQQTQEMWQGALRTYYYLFSLDDEGKVIGDTFHESLSNAKAQAQHQFGIGPEQWRMVD